MNKTIFPRPIDYERIDLSWMIGRSFSDVRFLEPTLWRFSLCSYESIDAECLWRLVDDRHIVRTSNDHGQQFGLAAPIDASAEASRILAHATVVGVELFNATADIHITLSDRQRLEIIPESSGYEGWTVRGPDGVCFVAQGGGQICTWIEEANKIVAPNGP
jgi:hypothetical protein